MSAIAEQGPRVIQNRVNKWCGLALALGSCGLFWLMAPLQWTQETDPSDSLGISAAGSTVFCAVLTASALRWLWRPRLVIANGEVKVINPIRVYRVPLHAIHGIRTARRRYPVLELPERRIRLIGAEHSLAMRAKGDRHHITRSMKPVRTEAGPGMGNEDQASVGVDWAPPTALELAAGAYWLVALTMVVTKWATGGYA